MSHTRYFKRNVSTNNPDHPDEYIQIEVYYALGEGFNQKRGMKASFFKVQITDAGDGWISTKYSVFGEGNMTLHLLDMPRKSAKVGELYASTAEIYVDKLYELAMAQEWQQIFNVFSEGAA